MVTLIIILGALLAAAVCRLALLKRDVRQMGGKLKTIAGTDTNAQAATETFDRDMIALADSINVTLERSRRDLIDKIRAEADLKRAITNISHDLRTPLTSALGYLQMLEGPGLDDETRARYIATISGRLLTLSELMNSLFEFARIIEGKAEFDLQRTDAGAALRGALSEWFGDFVSKGFSVDADIPETPSPCVCDADALRRVLQNLLKNAYVHGKEKLIVSLSGGKPPFAGGPARSSGENRSGAGAANHLTIKIANKANGLDDLETARLFDRFYTADASRTSKNTGLGLAIAKELTERMGGRVTAHREGDMLVVQVTLPA